MGTAGRIVFVLAASTATPVAADARQSGDAALRHFTLDKPRDTVVVTPPSIRPPQGPALEADRLRGRLGVGYVDGADWATDTKASGRIFGFDLDWRSVTTTGRRTTLVEQQALTLGSRTGRWTVEAGDVFSMLSGVGRGARVSFSARGGRRPALLVSHARRPFEDRPTLITYRDRLPLGSRAFIDGEVATDGSYFIAGRVATRRFGFDLSERRRKVSSTRDLTIGGSVSLSRHVRLLASAVESSRAGLTSRWHTAGFGVRVGGIDVTVERAVSVDGPVTQRSSSITVGAMIGSTHLFHRQQWGQLAYETPGVAFLQGMNHSQSMATIAAGARLQLTLQMASQWQADGRVSLWEELYALWRIRRGTALDLTTVVPRFERDRLRVRLTQDLPLRFAIEIEHGRVSPYQATTVVDGRPRTRALLLYRFDLAAPRGRAAVRGTVVDHLGRPVPRAVVRAGEYATTADTEGRYGFHNLPPGQYEIKLDAEGLSADHAWDGRGTRIDTRRHYDETVILNVAPLATLTGRVFVDRNGDSSYSPGEEVSGASLFLDEGRGTTTDRFGTYGFYNLRPGNYRIRIETRSLPATVRPSALAIHASLDSDRPVTGLDFVLHPVERPVLWSGHR